MVHLVHRQIVGSHFIPWAFRPQRLTLDGSDMTQGSEMRSFTKPTPSDQAYLLPRCMAFERGIPHDRVHEWPSGRDAKKNVEECLTTNQVLELI